MLNKKLIKHAEGVYNQYRYEIDCKLDVAMFFKDKFKNDQDNIKKLCNNLYKNHVKDGY